MRSKLVGLFAAGLLIWFLVALMRIATLPLAAGDAYPAYSSLRTDPRGAKALYESLAALRELRVERNFQPLPKLKNANAAVLLLGVPAGEGSAWGEDELKLYESIANSGGQLIVAFLPEAPHAPPRQTAELKKEHKSPPIEKRWRVTVETYEGTEDQIDEAGSMPRSTWAYFDTDAKSGWRVLERNDQDDPTLIEHDFGKGRILLLTESYPLSNEGLRSDRPVELIETLAGAQTRIIFDESHLGVSDTGSVGTLIRRYRLTGAFAVLLLLGLLFLWKNSTSLLPQAVEPASVAAATGADAQSGLVNLLKRSVPAAQLTRVGWERWKETIAIGRPVSGQRIARAELELDAGGSQTAIYRKIQTILTEKI